MAPFSRASVAAASLLVLSFLAPPVAAEEKPAGNPVVAIVNGEEIHLSILVELLPEQYRENMDTFYPMALQQAVDIVLLRQAAERAIPPGDAEVQKKVDELRKQIVFQTHLSRELKKRMIEEAVEAAYQDYVAANPPVEETRARHILMDTEAEAQAIVIELKGGADFAALAEERSFGPSAPQGGDISYFTDDRVVEPFAKAAAAIKPGEFGTTPVQTQFGWHIIKVEDRRMTEPASLEAVREEIEKRIERDVLTDLVAAERNAAELEFFDLDGSPIEGANKSEEGNGE
jgi:peptidyl-prolyl cis-trans isomerase C